MSWSVQTSNFDLPHKIQIIFVITANFSFKFENMQIKKLFFVTFDAFYEYLQYEEWYMWAYIWVYNYVSYFCNNW